MYQYGNDALNEQAYYIGLVGEDPLSYPDMGGLGPGRNVPVPTVKASDVKAAVGLSTTNKYDLLALASLFIAEGRRDRLTLLTHLLLMDLIEDRVSFGQHREQVPVPPRTVDVSGVSQTKLKDYKTTNLGDSPMAHKGASRTRAPPSGTWTT